MEQGSVRLAVELKGGGDSAAVGTAITAAKVGASRIGSKVLPVVAVPYMGDVGKKLCADAGVSWFDLSGNAHIIATGLRILIEGKPNRFVRRGRPGTAFAPKSSRIARRMLIEPRRTWRQQDLARETGLDDGFTSRIVQRLEDDHLLERTPEGKLRVRNHDLLLDSWAEVYDFNKHTIVRGHVTTRDCEELLGQIGGAFEGADLQYAVTGLAAAYEWTQFAGFRLATVFVEHHPPEAILKKLGFREETKGANVWLVVPNDGGVFDGTDKFKVADCVHPVQAYVDLKAHSERAQEAAAELRSRLLRWAT